VVFASIAISGIGFLAPSNTVSEVVECADFRAAAGCPDGDETLAHKYGLQKGDRILSIGGKSISVADDVRPIMEPLVGKSAVIKFERGGKTIAITAPIQNYKVFNLDTAKYELRPYLGVYFGWEHKPQPLAKVGDFTVEALGSTFGMIGQLPAQAFHAAAAIAGSEERGSEGAVSIVGIAKVAGDTAVSNGEEWIDTITVWLMMLSSLNFALFAFNMIPVLPLDGGHIAAAIYGRFKLWWFKVRGLGAPRPVDLALLAPLTMVGWAALTLMGVLFIIADVVAPMSL
jgi:membrane-associated protease RseP (regulator of RpoE activity)